MRIAGYLVTAILGLMVGWWLFSPGDEEGPTPAPSPAQPPPASSSGRPPVPTPPPAPYQPAPYPPRYQLPPEPPGQSYRYRPLTKREEERLQSGQSQDQLPFPDQAPLPYYRPGYPPETGSGRAESGWPPRYPPGR